MTSNAEFHIFRDGRRRVHSADLISRLRTSLSQLSSGAALDNLLSLFLLAAELECALTDATASEFDVAAASRLTEILAEAAIRCDETRNGESHGLPVLSCQQILQSIGYSGSVSSSIPEGFAYYALHPLDFSDLAARLQRNYDSAFVVGVRSIGAALSAEVGVKLRQLGVQTERTTVRPFGHPYDRRCEFSAAQQHRIAVALASGAKFMVCDEGPGRSGSSLLSVCEALEREGVPADRILILCSHQPDANALCAPDAALRWSRYRCEATGMSQRLPAGLCMGGGEWRRHLLGPGEPWPAVWPQMEPLKYFPADGRELLTFEGHGPYGAAARARNEGLSKSGLGVAYAGHKNGFSRHVLSRGRLLRRADLTPDLLAHMARYCAWRAREFSATSVDSCELEIMTRDNLAREFGAESTALDLPVERPAVCDNRMAAHYWLAADDGRVRKLDAALHGDDHFFPGPCDIAWDLAGVIVECNLDARAREFFLRQYQSVSGDDASRRIESYQLAYAMFRLAWSRMAAASVPGEEEKRLMSDYRRYRSVVDCSVSSRQTHGAAIWKRSTACAMRY